MTKANLTPTQLLAQIVAVRAVPLTKGFRIDIELADGSTETIKGKSSRKPSMVQLHSCHVNGNYQGDGAGRLFTFAKSADSWNKEAHLKGYSVI